VVVEGELLLQRVQHQVQHEHGKKEKMTLFKCLRRFVLSSKASVRQAMARPESNPL